MTGREFRGAEFYQADDGGCFVNVYWRLVGEDFVRRVTLAERLTLPEAVGLKRLCNQIGDRLVLDGA